MADVQWWDGGKGSLELIRFGDFLREKNALTDEQLLDVLAEHWARGERLGVSVARRGFLSRAEVERFAAEYHQLMVVEVSSPDAGAGVPQPGPRSLG
jgi:hypothetical protein